MKKTKTTFEDAIATYKTLFGTEPTQIQITNLYYEYSKNWKHYKGFSEWLMYTQD